MVDPQVVDALQLVKTDAVTKRIFEIVSANLGISGWQLAKTVDQDPSQTGHVLNLLTEKGIFRTPSPGLDGNYGLTSLGFTLKEQLAGGQFSR
jgi:hypothetical protein